MLLLLPVLVLLGACLPWINCQSNDELHACTEAIYAADSNSFPDNEVQYDRNGDALFSFVNEDRFQNGVYPSFRNLLTLYNPLLGNEDIIPDADIDAFLDAALASQPMSTAQDCLIGWGLVSDADDFRSKLRDYWFLKYSRADDGTTLDSSGFEHVFQGEVREGGSDVTGMHSWINIYDAEQRGEYVHGQSNNDCGDNLIQINDCTYLGANKPISSIWIGKSPELEMALYTVCFMTRLNQNCNIEVDGGRAMTIVNFDFSGASTRTIGTAYPEC